MEIFSDKINKLVSIIRKDYKITTQILLADDDSYFTPLFNIDEISKLDIHELNTSSPRIIALGDIHGDLQALLGVLYSAELIDDDGKWKEQRSTYVVQTGDLFDNYRIDYDSSCLGLIDTLDEFIILHYLTQLHRQAQAQKNKSSIILCIGNHELMNMYSDFRYINKNTKSKLIEEVRKKLFTNGSFFSKKMASIFRVVAKIENYLFMHGGIHDDNIGKLDDIVIYNKELYNWLYTPIDPVNPIIISSKITDLYYNSIAWTRHFYTLNSTEEQQKVENFLNRLDKKNKLKVIVGHSPMYNNINIKCNERVILLDTEMSRAFRNSDENKCDLKYNHINYIFIENNNIKYITVKNNTRFDKTYKDIQIEQNIRESLINKKIDLQQEAHTSLIYILKTYENIKKTLNIFSNHNYNFIIFNIEYYTEDFEYFKRAQIGLATIDIKTNTLHKVYLIEDKTTLIEINELKNQIKFNNIIKYTEGLRKNTTFTITLNNPNELIEFKKVSPLLKYKEGGRLRSKSNKNHNKITKSRKTEIRNLASKKKNRIMLKKSRTVENRKLLS